MLIYLKLIQVCHKIILFIFGIFAETCLNYCLSVKTVQVCEQMFIRLSH